MNATDRSDGIPSSFVSTKVTQNFICLTYNVFQHGVDFFLILLRGSICWELSTTLLL